MEQYQPDLADFNNYVVVDEMRLVFEHQTPTKFVNVSFTRNNRRANKIALCGNPFKLGLNLRIH